MHNGCSKRESSRIKRVNLLGFSLLKYEQIALFIALKGDYLVLENILFAVTENNQLKVQNNQLKVKNNQLFCL